MALNQPSSQPQSTPQIPDRERILGQEIDQAVTVVLETAASGENPEQAIQNALSLLSRQAPDIPTDLSAEACRAYNDSALNKHDPRAREIGIALNTLRACKDSREYRNK